MSKSQEQEQESIDNIRQQFDEEYKNLSWVQVGYLALGADTGNKKYDELNKRYLDLNKDNLGIIQVLFKQSGMFLVHCSLPGRLLKFYLILHWSLITSEKREVLPLV